ncbi:MAG: hypothetical protein HY721_13915 [Planctomycetes bacterium]|nr:hypothetical protein [Planctomycetota bacterium]
MRRLDLGFGLPAALLPLLAACRGPGDAAHGKAGSMELSTFDGIVAYLEGHADAIVLEGDGGSRAVVSPRLQGRIVTAKVGAVESTGFVNAAAISKGDADPQFNNHGGLDRFWIGPEAGPYGLYFPAGADFHRTLWKVPPDLNSGSFRVASRDASRVVLARDMEVASYVGTRFLVAVERELGTLGSKGLPEELGVSLPAGVRYTGVYSRNTLRNRGPEAWAPEKGLIGIWILGMLNPSDSAVIIGPFRPGSDKDLGPPFNDEYFGKVTAEAPERLKVLGNAVVFRADSRRVGKFGISQARTTGVAGAVDFSAKLLTIVKFDVPPLPERYGNGLWLKDQGEPYKGDALQSYNNGVPDAQGPLPEAPFYELESASPVRPLGPGEAIVHRHATHHFQGDLEALATIAKQVLGVDLAAVRAAMLR